MSGWTVRFLFKFSPGRKHKLMNRCFAPFSFSAFLNQYAMYSLVNAGYKINQSVLAGNFYNLMQKTVNKDVVIIDACI